MVAALAMVVWNRRPDRGVIHHSDHGRQYTALAFTKRIGAGWPGGFSVESVGDALDRARAESCFATLQTELLDRGRWATSQSLTTAIFSYVEGCYHRRRRPSAPGYLSPRRACREGDECRADH